MYLIPYHITSDNSEISCSQVGEFSIPEPSDVDIFYDILLKVQLARLYKVINGQTSLNISDFGYLEDQALTEPEDLLMSMASLYEIMTTYSWSLLSCPGCIHNSLGQHAHMQHPHGCLHDSNFCDECI